MSTAAKIITVNDLFHSVALKKSETILFLIIYEYVRENSMKNFSLYFLSECNTAVHQ